MNREFVIKKQKVLPRKLKLSGNLQFILVRGLEENSCDGI